MTETALKKDHAGWFSIFSSTLTAVVVGFASTILVIMEAARNVGASPSQQASWAAALCFGTGRRVCRLRVGTPGAAGAVKRPAFRTPLRGR